MFASILILIVALTMSFLAGVSLADKNNAGFLFFGILALVLLIVQSII